MNEMKLKEKENYHLNKILEFKFKKKENNINLKFFKLFSIFNYKL